MAERGRELVVVLEREVLDGRPVLCGYVSGVGREGEGTYGHGDGKVA